MGAKSAPKTRKWGQKAPPKPQSGQKAPPLKSGLKKCGGKKCRQNAKVGAKKRRQNSKVTAKSATTQIRGKKSWWLKVPSKWKNGGGKCHQSKESDGRKCHYISNCGGTLTTTYHIQGAGAPAKRKLCKR